jgi:hypothetical protein
LEGNDISTRTMPLELVEEVYDLDPVPQFTPEPEPEVELTGELLEWPAPEPDREPFAFYPGPVVTVLGQILPLPIARLVHEDLGRAIADAAEGE